jgi:CO/xanthine dehydrogenase Mo-binding subunit
MSYRRMHNGRIELFDWQPVAKAVRAAYAELGKAEPEGGIPQEDWNLVAVAISEFKEAQKYTCIHCRTTLERHEEIRCIDCKAVMCESCAKLHFWPNGRPKDDLPR